MDAMRRIRNPQVMGSSPIAGSRQIPAPQPKRRGVFVLSGCGLGTYVPRLPGLSDPTRMRNRRPAAASRPRSPASRPRAAIPNQPAALCPGYESPRSRFGLDPGPGSAAAQTPPGRSSGRGSQWARPTRAAVGRRPAPAQSQLVAAPRRLDAAACAGAARPAIPPSTGTRRPAPAPPPLAAAPAPTAGRRARRP